MKSGLILLFTVIGVAVWGFAIVGLLSFTEAIASDATAAAPQRAPLLASLGADASDDDVIGLPRFPGSDLSEYDRERRGAMLVTEIEYRADAGSDTVSGYFRRLFDRGGWTVLDSSKVGGEWTYAIRAGAREATVEIDHADDLIRIRIALSEPALERDRTTDR